MILISKLKQAMLVVSLSIISTCVLAEPIQCPSVADFSHQSNGRWVLNQPYDVSHWTVNWLDSRVNKLDVLPNDLSLTVYVVPQIQNVQCYYDGIDYQNNREISFDVLTRRGMRISTVPVKGQFANFIKYDDSSTKNLTFYTCNTSISTPEKCAWTS